MADSADYRAIQNTIAQYCFALDNKDFAALHKVFTEDVDTIYPFRGAIKGVQEVADAIEKRYECTLTTYASVASDHPRLSPVTTQHALTTQ
jgi:ketosteroid isomerase-like protein